MGTGDGHFLGNARHAFLSGKVRVTDQAVGPKIDDFDFQFVFAAADNAGHVVGIWRFPKNAERLSIQRRGDGETDDRCRQ